jgi:hypothetical protein
MIFTNNPDGAVPQALGGGPSWTYFLISRGLGPRCGIEDQVLEKGQVKSATTLVEADIQLISADGMEKVFHLVRARKLYWPVWYIEWL